MLRDLKELLEIAVNTLTCVWYWIPICFMAYIFLSWYVMVWHPLTLAVVPAVLIGLLFYRRWKYEKSLVELYMKGHRFRDPEKMIEAYKLYMKRKRKDDE